MRLAAVCCAWMLALTLPCPTLEVECGHRGGQHKAAGDETRRHRGAGRGMHDALLVLRLRGGATRRGNKRSWGEEVATPHDGSRSRGEVVFPRDCSSLHEALLRCTTAVSAHENAVADSSNGKRGRCEPSAAKHTGPPCVQEECSAPLLSAAEQDAGCDKRLFVQFGHHEFGDDTLLVNARGTWSVRGIGDLSGAVDLLQLQALAASWPGGGASNETAAPQGKAHDCPPCQTWSAQCVLCLMFVHDDEYGIQGTCSHCALPLPTTDSTGHGMQQVAGQRLKSWACPRDAALR